MTKPIFILFAVLLIGVSTTAQAQEDVLGGSIQAEVDGRVVHFAALKTDVDASVQGDLATVRVVQTFSNPTKTPLQATYLFPLNKDSAVYAMTMEVGDEIVEAKIMKKEKAKATFEKAKQEGKAASLLTQHRPNMFTQNIANLMPGLPITVTLRYVQTVPRKDGAYELVVPLIVGPRYNHPDTTIDESADDRSPLPPPPAGQWSLAPPPHPPVAGLSGSPVPATVGRDRVGIHVALAAGHDIGEVLSRTHKIAVSGSGRAKTVALADGRTIDNADFVLRYTLAGARPQAGLLTHRDESGGYFSLLLEPPATARQKDISPREMVFVLDTSGSMGGMPMAASKAFMVEALKTLRPTDYFRIIRFGSEAREFNDTPLPATPGNVAAGLTFVKGLTAQGGTEIPKAIRRAFAQPAVNGVPRFVVFLSDGYIGYEREVLKLVHSIIGNARIYALGVGTSVNRYLLDEMTRAGRGFTRYMDPTEDYEAVAAELAGHLDAPMLTDISIDWGDLAVEDVTPARIPDLFAGDSLRLVGRFSEGGRHRVTVRGKIGGREAALPLDIDLSQGNSAMSQAIPLVWARTEIAEGMRQLNTPAGDRPSNQELEARITELGLTHSLATRFTSFVAVSRKVVNRTPDHSVEADVPHPMVKGVSELAYNHPNFAGGSTPEPATLGGLAVLAAAGAAALRRRKKAPSTVA